MNITTFVKYLRSTQNSEKCFRTLFLLLLSLTKQSFLLLNVQLQVFFSPNASLENQHLVFSLGNFKITTLRTPSILFILILSQICHSLSSSLLAN